MHFKHIQDTSAHETRTVKYWLKLWELNFKDCSIFTYKIIKPQDSFAVKHLLQYLELDSVNANPISLNYDVCYLREHNVLYSVVI